MTALASAAPTTPAGATLRQGAAAAILGFMGLLFFSIAIAGFALQDVTLPPAAAADAARLQGWAPIVVAIGVAHVLVAILAVGSSVTGRRIVAAAAAATAVAFAAGAVAIAAGWDIFDKVNGKAHFAGEGIAIFGFAALIYLAVAALVIRSQER